jgi:hypothetical protein
MKQGETVNKNEMQIEADYQNLGINSFFWTRKLF